MMDHTHVLVLPVDVKQQSGHWRDGVPRRMGLIAVTVMICTATSKSSSVNAFMNAAMSLAWSKPIGQHRIAMFRGSQTRRFPTSSQVLLQKEPAHASQACACPTVILKRSRQSKAFRDGSQLIFTRAIDRIQPENLQVGDLVHVVVPANNEKDIPAASTRQQWQDIGYGVYNSSSLYRVRLLCHKVLQPALYEAMTASSHDQIQAMRHILLWHLRCAMSCRKLLGLYPTQVNTQRKVDFDRCRAERRTDTYRLVNGEGDGLSGLAIDVIGGCVAVIMSSAAWVQVHRLVVEHVVAEVLPNCQLVWKTTANRLVQDGFGVADNLDLSRGSDENDHDGVLAWENGICYHTHPFGRGQKTGVYCDQRENRAWVAQYCTANRVLDLCCYHGGFALNAVVHNNAIHATGVDSSPDAIAACQTNSKLNGCSDRTTFIQADITTFLQSCAEEYDVVVLDPPKLAPTAAALEKARRKYHGLNRDAIKVISREHGGLLLTCTCSAAMTQKEGGQCFLDMVHGAALAAGRQVQLIKVSGAASCHTQSPVSWPAGAYLTAALFHVLPENHGI